MQREVAVQTLSMVDDGRGQAKASRAGCGEGTATLEPGPWVATQLQPPCEIGFIISIAELRKLTFIDSK